MRCLQTSAASCKASLADPSPTFSLPLLPARYISLCRAGFLVWCRKKRQRGVSLCLMSASRGKAMGQASPEKDKRKNRPIRRYQSKWWDSNPRPFGPEARGILTFNYHYFCGNLRFIGSIRVFNMLDILILVQISLAF